MFSAKYFVKVSNEAKVSNKTKNKYKRYLGASETPFNKWFRAILETSNIKIVRTALNFQNIFGV